MNDIKIIYNNLHEVKCKDCKCDGGSGGGSSRNNYIETTESSWFWIAKRTWTSFDTKAELCEFIGISEEELDSLLNGESRADLLAYWDFDGANMESILRYEKREYQEGVSLVQWLFYDAETYAFKEVTIMADEAYKVRGLGD